MSSMKGFIPILLAVALWSATPSTQPEELSRSEIERQMHQAAALFEQGHTQESKKIYDALFAALRNRPAPDQLGFVLNGLSKISAAGGDYNGAIQLAKQSAETYRQIGDASGESRSRNNEGIAEIQLGRYANAQRTLQGALELSRRGHDSENEVQVLNNLGSSYYFPGSYSEALRRYDEAMTAVDRNGSAEWSDYWRQITSFNQATLFQRLGRYERALQIYRQVEQSSKGLTPSDRAHLFANLGALYRRLGDPYKALDIYRAAQKLYSEQHDAGGELTVTKNIGIVYALDMKDLQQAEKIFRSAISLAQKTHNRREAMQAHLYLAETLFRAQNFAESREEFTLTHGLALDLGTTEEEWKSQYGIGRVEELSGNFPAAETDYREAIAVIEKTRTQLQLAALRSEFFADKREAYDALIALLVRKNNIEDAFSFLERSRARNFQDRLQTAQAKSLDNSLNLARIRANLPPETALLEFWTSGEQVGLIWSTWDKSGIAARQLSPAEMTSIRGFLDSLPNVLDGDWQHQVQALDVLLTDTASALAGIRHVLIVPDGWISFVPFDLMQADLNSKSTMLEKYDISYLPTAALLLRSRPPQRSINFPWTQELAAFGDPVIGSNENASPELENDASQHLPYSATEILALASLVHGHKELFLQQRDLKKYFLDSASNNASLLHISTHAFADGDSPENSRLLFSSEFSDLGPDYVFLREIYELNLSHVRLATISACDTERGKIIRGEGVQAFSRALLSAGAAASLTTLWRVDDEPTAEFMKQFYYFALHDHRPKAEALRLAKLKFLHSNSKLADPRLWAAFVLNGDGATPLPTVWSWSELAAGVTTVLAAVLIALALVLRRRSRVHRQQRPRAVVA